MRKRRIRNTLTGFCFSEFTAKIWHMKISQFPTLKLKNCNYISASVGQKVRTKLLPTFTKLSLQAGAEETFGLTVLCCHFCDPSSNADVLIENQMIS